MAPSFARPFLSLGLLFTLAACATDSTGPVELAPETTLPLRYLSTIGPLGANLPQLGIRGMGFGGPALQFAPVSFRASTNAMLAARLAALPGGAMAALALSSPTCVADAVGAGVDSDGDGVPNDATWTFTAANCTTYDSATGEAYLTRGSYRIRDTNDDLYGFQFDVNALTVRRTNGNVEHTWAEVVYNMNESARTTATAGTYHLVVDASSASGDNVTWSAQRSRYDLTESFTPTGTIVAGGPLPDGTMTISGTADLALADVGPPVRLVFQLVGTAPLVYDNGCPGVTSGAFEMRLNGSTTEGVHVVYSACAGHYEPLGAGTL